MGHTVEPFSFRKNGKLIIVNSVLENIDTLTEEELKEVLLRFKDVLSPIMTSIYIPSVSMMKIIKEEAPEMRVRFKTEKSGGSFILPITCDEFFEGEAYFDSILNGINLNWTELQKYKYLYNSLGMMLSYDLNVTLDGAFSSIHEKYARNIFTSIARNWGICSSFAAGYDYLCYRAGLESEIVSEEEHDYVVISVHEKGDYLVDPTWDAAFLKFGIKTRNFGISKEQFINGGHHLEQTEVEDYEIEALTEDELEELDQSIGYLDLFGGAYTNIQAIIDHLDGDSVFLKIASLLDVLKELKVVGRPSLNDYENLLNDIVLNDPVLRGNATLFGTVLENHNRAILVRVSMNEKIEQYVLEEGFYLKKEGMKK